MLWRCEVLIATERIPKGERLYPWQTALERRYMSRCPKQSLSQEELLNYVTLKQIKKGELHKEELPEKMPLVRRGDEVDVIFRSGNLEIGFRGEALDTGFYGDTIRVKSLNTGKVLRGRIVSEGSVLVR
ncbi:MAG: flagellar basal body P-ring formation chaperone FlgA [Aquificota bacterium]|nr:flagellar basal body P-ring formation chaperone FlgA [Aquificota bacterium]